MDIYLNNNLVETDKTKLAEILDTVKEQLSPSGQVIVEIRIDGKTLDQNQIAEQKDEPLKATEVQLISADPCDLAIQTLLEIKDALTQAQETQKTASQLLQEDNATDALDHIRDSLTTWQQTQQSVSQAAQLLNIPLDQITIGDQKITQVIEDLSELLIQLREQLTANDWLGLADTIAYPLTESITTWKQLIDALIDKIEKIKTNA